MGPHSLISKPLANAPIKMAHGMGLPMTRPKACFAARFAPSMPAPSKRDKATHSEVVSNISTKIVAIAGPALAAPSNMANNGTPINPVLGKAATKAPKEASFHPMAPRLVMTMVSATIMRALAA